MGKAKIRVLLIEPKEHPRAHTIEPTRHAFEKAVNVGAAYNGKVEVKKLEHGIYALYNKDRYLTELTPNRQIGDDIIVGKLFVVAVDDHRKPISMTDEQMIKYALRFWHAEEFDDMDVMESNMNTFLLGFLQDA